ncbi:aminotransferase class V-fold PLP-dependent enzyme [Streptomyces litchfieldiae]|uniref:Aminotransferase class V-fold PLP-dependent enzyme n=1 Tax=Streptomyces litchfieldiae TaxID=3075543 RepID=A0ABU2MRU3_9ACTN|nr:aminotransferase class V-fold PLP-dependent enzyme [Streptomyces sp. DSM 44938]MDT0344346.1 aminotransferase class V-fold PLP-dependent enzyme [Streptomyces sp. DSM 44938]
MDPLSPDEYAPRTTYLNTAAHGLLPARSVAALREAVAGMGDGRVDTESYFAAVTAARAAFGRLTGVPAERVAVGATVAAHTALVAASLPPGSEVLFAENEFSSLVTPFAQRGTLVTRAVPLTELAGEVRPRTALVAVSATQSLDGRDADLPAIAKAARRHGARTLVDLTQAAGWSAVSAADFDFTVCAAYKWLLCPRGTSFLTVPPDGGGLRALHAGWVAGEEPWNSTYGPVAVLAAGARRFDESPAFLSWVAAARSLSLVAELGRARIAAHDLELARRFRAGLAELGLTPVPGGSPVVAVPGLGGAAAALEAAGVRMAARGGNLRASFHLYNSAADVDRALTVLADAGRGQAALSA